MCAAGPLSCAPPLEPSLSRPRSLASAHRRLLGSHAERFGFLVGVFRAAVFFAAVVFLADLLDAAFFFGSSWTFGVAALAAGGKCLLHDASRADIRSRAFPVDDAGSGPVDRPFPRCRDHRGQQHEQVVKPPKEWATETR